MTPAFRCYIGLLDRLGLARMHGSEEAQDSLLEELDAAWENLDDGDRAQIRHHPGLSHPEQATAFLAKALS